MSYVTPLGNIPIYDDANAQELVGGQTIDGEKMSLGYVSRNYEAQPPGTIPFCAPWDESLRIPRERWASLCEQQDKHESSLHHVRQRAGIKTKSQNGTNFCWFFGTVAAAQLARANSGAETVELSPTAGACLVKNYRNRGGNTFDAIPHLAEHGVPSTKLWPLNQLDRRYDTPEMREEAKRYRLTEWHELPSNDFDAAASCLLRNMPVVMGLMWWSHMVCGLRLVVTSPGKYGILIENSHGEGYGEKGLAVLSESKATAFDQAALRVMTA